MAAIRRSGTPVLVLQPGPGDTATTDGRAMDPAARTPVARRAREGTLAALAPPSKLPSAAAVRDVLG